MFKPSHPSEAEAETEKKPDYPTYELTAKAEGNVVYLYWQKDEITHDDDPLTSKDQVEISKFVLTYAKDGSEDETTKEYTADQYSIDGEPVDSLVLAPETTYNFSLVTVPEDTTIFKPSRSSESSATTEYFPISALNAITLETMPATKSAKFAESYQGRQYKGVISANNEHGNLSKIIAVQDMVTGDEPGHGVIIWGSAYDTYANYPVGKTVTVTLTSSSLVYNYNGTPEVEDVKTTVDESSEAAAVNTTIVSVKDLDVSYVGTYVEILEDLAVKNTDKLYKWSDATATELVAADGDVTVYRNKNSDFDSEITPVQTGSKSVRGIAMQYKTLTEIYPTCADDLKDFTLEIPEVKVTDIEDVPAAGVKTGWKTFTSSYDKNAWTISVEADGEVVTDATVIESTILYDVSANTTDKAREGYIIVSFQANDTDVILESEMIVVSQLTDAEPEPTPDPEPTMVTDSLIFGSEYNSAKVQNYTTEWEVKSPSTKITAKMVNWNNNNNGWAYVRAGVKNAASTADIIAAVADSVYSVTMTVDATLTKTAVDDISLYVSADGTEWGDAVQTILSADLSEGDLVLTVPAEKRAKNLSYKISVSCNDKSSSNGPIQVSKVKYLESVIEN